jgi:hypothetical protein
MTVDVALFVLVGASVPHLLLQDEEGRCAGLVTRARPCPAGRRQRSGWGTRRKPSWLDENGPAKAQS